MVVKKIFLLSKTWISPSRPTKEIFCRKKRIILCIIRDNRTYVLRNRNKFFSLKRILRIFPDEFEYFRKRTAQTITMAIVECYSARIGIKWDTEMRSKIEKQRGTTRQWIGRKLHHNVKNECNASVD